MRRQPFIVIALLLGMLAMPAHAQVATFDASNALGQAKSLLQELRSYGTQLSQLQQEVQTATTTAETAASLIQHPSLGAAQQLMGLTGLNNDLPINPGSLSGLVSGYGGMNSVAGLTGKLTSLGGLVNGNFAANGSTNCVAGSFTCQQMNQTAAGNAGTQGIAQQIYADLTNHIPVLNALRAQLGISTDPAQRENIMAQVQMEQTWTANAESQIQTAMLMNTAQQQVNSANAMSHTDSDLKAIIAAAVQH